MNNSWNKVIYNFWSPIYDQFFNSGTFLNVRKEMFKGLVTRKNRKILNEGLEVKEDVPVMLNGIYRRIIVSKLA